MNLKEIAALKAIEFVKEGMTIGLGTGSTVKYFIEEVGRLCQEGMTLKGVATSLQTEKLARDLNIPLLQIDEVDYLDLGVDGADEVDLE
ncbi:MAG TPA: ribose-5-phosphate isomerase A, partial [Bacilli bacterium]